MVENYGKYIIYVEGRNMEERSRVICLIHVVSFCFSNSSFNANIPKRNFTPMNVL